jgi:hypothetical protein
MHRQRHVPPPAEGAQFVKAGDMVEMRVGVDDGVDLAQSVAQGLRAQVRPGAAGCADPARCKPRNRSR